MLNKLSHWIFKPVVNTIFPPVCFLCDSFLENNRRIVCKKCWSEMHQLTKNQIIEIEKQIEPKYFDNIFIIFDFSDMFQKIIHLLKYERCLTLSKYFADEIIKRFEPSFFQDYDIIIPVPLHPVKFRERGYNQSFEILKHLGSKVDNGLLKRTKNTVSQTKLSREKRIENVNEAFQCTTQLTSKKILLFDDIITTGSTVNACTIALKDCECSNVDVMALATPTLPIN